MSKEVKFGPSEILLSTTDLDSHVKYVNKNFCKIAGYSLEEMVGKPHNLVRHPDMPKAAFKDLWSFIQSGNSWMGPVKNRCENGDYYWVNAFVTPIKDESGKVHEYQSVRTCPEPEVIKRAEKLYPKMNAGRPIRQAKKQKDATLWLQLMLVLMTLLSLASLFINESNLILDLVSTGISIAAVSVMLLWRKKYRTVVNEAKQVFDNPLMSYLYSGNNDDVGSITLALKMRKAELNAVVGRVSDDSVSITNSAQESSERGNGVARILGEQKNETEQVAVAINQMLSTVQEISQAVTSASDSAQQGLDISTDGQVIVKETISAINELSSQLTEVESAISRLINGSRAITAVLGEISSIADQTNLLALNAAIEAARAGEQGRGFAVVAEEVRALAMRSQQSTEEISKLLEQLEKESELATQAMTKGSQLSNNCVEQVNKTGDSLTRIGSDISDLANMSMQISAAVEEQSVTVEQISQNIVSIRDMSSDSEAHGQEAVQLSDKLLRRLNQQTNLVAQFQS
ncbi:methyl-accepting chemotaxis protein [Cognaticolwellia mytili]|uniref:methyl-accepting chemotaxis protein n=1 Tax=Cognaticolwellia mytili TaxID=1888913 RepID=UPI000A175923|nr:PAS domain-containing methyl-accepting chemotaxis protein [Cognaticolwellia mytili]